MNEIQMEVSDRLHHTGATTSMSQQPKICVLKWVAIYWKTGKVSMKRAMRRFPFQIVSFLLFHWNNDTIFGVPFRLNK